MRIKGDYIIANLLGHVVPVEVVAEMGKPDRILKKKNFVQMVAKIGQTGWNSEEKTLFKWSLKLDKQN